MAAYCTQADIQNRFDTNDLINLTNDSEDATTVIAAVVTQAIADGDATINSYLRGRYTVADLASTDPQIKQMSVKLAVYNLWARRTDPPLHVVAEKQDTIQMLKDLAANKALLTTTQAGSSPRFFRVNKDSDDRDYTSTVLDTFGL